MRNPLHLHTMLLSSIWPNIYPHSFVVHIRGQWLFLYLTRGLLFHRASLPFFLQKWLWPVFPEREQGLKESWGQQNGRAITLRGFFFLSGPQKKWWEIWIYTSANSEVFKTREKRILQTRLFYDHPLGGIFPLYVKNLEAGSQPS